MEIPQVYGGRQGKGDPNDLIAMAYVAGCLTHAGVRTAEKHCVLPREWKGQVPKDIHNKRVMSKLNPDEVAIIEAIKPASKRHNAIDAVGIGKWFFEKNVVPMKGKK